MEGGSVEVFLDILVGNLPPMLYDGVALSVTLLAGGVKGCGTRVAQINKATSGSSGELVSGNPCLLYTSDAADE